MSLGGDPEAYPNPMILGIEPLIPYQKASTRDPSIEKMIYHRIEREGSYHLRKLSLNQHMMNTYG
jgi:hypothetical protein